MNALDLILSFRNDLVRHFTRNDHFYLYDYIYWVLVSGVVEYPQLKNDAGLIRYLNSKSNHHLTNLELAIWSARQDLRDAFSNENPVPLFRDWLAIHGVKEYDLGWALSCRSSDGSAPAIGDGVNVLGYFGAPNGIGEDARMFVECLASKRISYSAINVGEKEPCGIECSALDDPRGFKYAVNVFCMPAVEHVRQYFECPKELSGFYNIGYWPWEFSDWPAKWKNYFSLVDEIWVSTSHIYDAVVKYTDKPVFLMPMAVAVRKNQPSKATRDAFGIPADAYVFFFSFDLNSSINRKNPYAVFDAFFIAFKLGCEDVALVIKIQRPKATSPDWDAFKALCAADSRVILIEDTLSKAELHLLYASCDSFVSLHRCEGFGRNIAEAMLLGMHIVTTGYSGNLDFCTGYDVDLVSYTLKEVRPGEYMYADGMVWAEPSVNEAAGYMRAAYVEKKRGWLYSSFERFSQEYVGRSYLSRLEDIWSK